MSSSISDIQAQYDALKKRELSLDLTRGKPSAEQLSLSEDMLAISVDELLAGNEDLRNYGGLDGLPACKALGAMLLDVPIDNVLVGGNASLTLMYHTILTGWLHGFSGEPSWSAQQEQGAKIKFLCPVPGYDRHFSITESFGIEMLSVPMNADGPDMNVVEDMIAKDSGIKGMWCVPKYSNPTGCIYSERVVNRLASLGKIIEKDFRIMYDNAYAVHDLQFPAASLASMWQAADEAGYADTVIQFASTSKVTLAGAGVSFIGASDNNLSSLKKHLGVVTIGPDKLNQARHTHWLPDQAALTSLMQKHAEILKPKFEMVLDKLEQGFAGEDFASWEKADGGYFVSVYVKPGCASKVVKLCSEAGVKLTGAGAAYPLGNDPQDSHIRLAPSFPLVEDLNVAMDVFVAAVKLATLQNA